MKSASKIMAILMKEMELAEREWDYVFEHDTSDREKDRALDRLIALDVLYKKITREAYQ